MTTFLEQRVREYNIPKWPGSCCFNSILIYRIPDKAAERKTYVPGGMIQIPDDQKSNREFRSPRGIVVAAGLVAADVLRGHGICLGDIIWMSSWTPFRFEVDTTTEGKAVEFFFMQAENITLDEDLEERKLAGKVHIEVKNGKHELVIDDECIPRFDPIRHPDDI